MDNDDETSLVSFLLVSMATIQRSQDLGLLLYLDTRWHCDAARWGDVALVHIPVCLLGGLTDQR